MLHWWHEGVRDTVEHYENVLFRIRCGRLIMCLRRSVLRSASLACFLSLSFYHYSRKITMDRLLRLGHAWVIGAPAHYTRSVQASTLQQAQRLHRAKSCNSGIDQTITHLDTRYSDGLCRHGMVDKERLSAIVSTVARSLRMERDRASCCMVGKGRVWLKKEESPVIAITVARSFRMV